MRLPFQRYKVLEVEQMRLQETESGGTRGKRTPQTGSHTDRSLERRLSQTVEGENVGGSHEEMDRETSDGAEAGTEMLYP